MMFPKRFKIGTARNNEWRCCFCLHVRTAAILLGVWHLLLHILALTVLALVMRNHNINTQRNNEDFDQNNFLPTPLSKIKDDDNPYYLPTTQDGRPIYSSDIDMNALMTVCTLSVTLLMVYGAIKGKATHLLPFFCLQLFDFALTTLTATGYFCYLRSVHRLVAEHFHNLPFKNDLLKLSPQSLSLLILVGFLITMVWKAYSIGIVWRCYKYLTFRQQTLRNTIHYILPHDGGERIPEPDYSTLLREQEAAFGHLKQTPPPSYQDIMNEQPPPYVSASLTTTPTTTTRAVVIEPQCSSPEPQEQPIEISTQVDVVTPSVNNNNNNTEIATTSTSIVIITPTTSTTTINDEINNKNLDDDKMKKEKNEEEEEGGK